jgi:hypothetical protein
MIRIKRINKEDVQPVKFIDEVEDKRPVKGADIFPEIYANIFFCARKKSGKSCAIAHIIEHCSTRETRVIAFVSTLHRDPTWRAIEKMCSDKHIDFTGYTSIKDPSTKEDILDTIVKALEESSGEEGKDEKPQMQIGSGVLTDFDPDPATKTGKPKIPKWKAPKIIFVFDDLSGELQTPSVTQLLKKNRHFKCKVLLSSQYFNDVALQGRKQIDYLLLYRGLAQSADKLKDIYHNCDMAVPFEVFVAVYRYATAKKFNFLYVDVVNSEFRKNFSHKIELPNEEDEDEVRNL